MHITSFKQLFPIINRCVFHLDETEPGWPQILSVVQVAPASQAETQLVRGALRGAGAASGSAGGDGATLYNQTWKS